MIAENYPVLPIVPLYGNPEEQSELVGIRDAIDCYDLLKSGFADTLQDMAELYWTIQNAGGMDQEDLQRFVHQLRTVRAAVLEDQGQAQAHTLDMPYQAKMYFLQLLEQNLYSDFGAVNVQNLMGREITATQIQAAYQNLDNKVDAYEGCVKKFFQGLFQVLEIQDEPMFNRSRIVDQGELTQMVISAAPYLDKQTVVENLPFLAPKEQSRLVEKLCK
jgi:hypothetical protein